MEAKETKSKETPVKKSKKSSRGKTLLILVLILAALVAGVFAAKKITAKATAEEETAAETELTAFSADADSVDTVSYTVNGSEVSFEKQNDTWQCLQDSDMPVSQSKVNSLVTKFSSISAKKEITEPDDMSSYGLSEPQTTVTLGETILSFGDESELDGYQYFSCGDGKVYLIDSALASDLTDSILNYVQKEEIPAIDLDSVKSFVVSWNKGGYEIVHEEENGLAYSDEYTWFWKDGNNLTALDPNLTETVVEKVTNLQWQSCEDAHATDETLKADGLLPADLTVTVTYIETAEKDTGKTDSNGEAIKEEVNTEKTLTLNLCGALARLEDSNMVYSIDSTLADTLRYTTLTELLPTQVIALDGSDVTAVQVKADGLSLKLEKTSEAVTTDETTTMETIWKQDGETVKAEDVFNTIEDMVTYGSTPNEKQDDVILKLVYTRDNETYPKTTLTFADYDSTYCTACVDGGIPVKVLRADVTSLMESFKNLTAE